MLLKSTEDVASLFVARQPIFNRDKSVFAYELLFRSSKTSQAYDGTDGSLATSQVIAATMFAFGQQDILAGKRGFFNFTRDHLLADYSRILDPANTIIEVLESVEPDQAVLAACLRLKASGYTLALDDFVAKDWAHPLAHLADIIKVDFRETHAKDQEALASEFGGRGITMLAEKVETEAEFRLARSCGYSLFQGYFFARPEVVRGKRIPSFRKHYYTLLKAIQRPDFSFNDIEALIRKDLSLIYKFLLFLNSARFDWLSRINSIHHALVLLGQQEVRKWMSLAIIASLGADRPPELIVTGATRAHFCELLGSRAGLEARSDSLLMLGMFSVMDAIMETTLDEILAGISLEPEVCEALLGTAAEGNRLAVIYRVVRAYEAGDWQSVLTGADQLGVPGDAIPAMYLKSVIWAEQTLASESSNLVTTS